MFAGIGSLITSDPLIAQLAEPAILVLYVKRIRETVLLPAMVAVQYGIGINSVAQGATPGMIAFVALPDGHAGIALIATPIMSARRSEGKGLLTGRATPLVPVRGAHRDFSIRIGPIMRAGFRRRVNCLAGFAVPPFAIVTEIIYGNLLDVADGAVPFPFPGTGFAFAMKRVVKNATVIMFAGLFRWV